MVSLDKAIAKGIGKIAVGSSRHAKPIIAIVLVMTIALGYGITMITTNVDVADVLPRGDPNTAAAYNLTESFRSTFTQQVTFQIHVDDHGGNWSKGNALLTYRGEELTSGLAPILDQVAPGLPFETRPDSNNITDEVYVRAMEEMVNFIQERTSFDRQVSINNIYALINWTIAGGEGVATEENFALPSYLTPEGAQQYKMVDVGVKAAVLDTVDALSSPSWNHAAVLFMPAADNKENIRDLGDSIIKAREEWIQAVDNGETVFKIWGSGNPPQMTVDLPVANAHSSNLVSEDFAKLMPIIAVFIIVCLYIAFRDIRSIAISFLTLTTGVVWTYGLMGYMGIALNTLNMTIVPLIMGVGIDYAIHMINEFMEHKAHGLSNEEAFIESGRRAGLAMFIATMTTVLGLVVMMFSPSLLMAQLGFLSGVAILSIYVLTLTLIPAALSLIGDTNSMGKSFSESKMMAHIGRGVTKTRYLMFLVVILLTVAAVFSAGNLQKEAFGDPGKNFPKDDEIRIQHEEGLEKFYEVENPTIKTNILTFEGPGILTPESMDYMLLIEENLRAKPRIVGDTLRTVPFFIDTWLTIKGGLQCVPVGMGQEQGQEVPVLGDILTQYNQQPGLPCATQTKFPQTEAAIRSEIEGMFASPMRELASIIINHPTLTMAAMTFGVDAGTYDEAEEAWIQIHDAIEEADQQMGGAPDGVYVNMVGNTATNYLFVAKQLPWLNYMGYASSAILAFLVLLFTRSIKATLVASFLAFITTFWWLGLLPSLGIGLAITLMLPLVFIFNIGTDYVVHMIWNVRAVGNVREVFKTTGKAILFSAVTTIGAFAIFGFIQNVAVSRTMIATTLAIVIIFLSTMMVIPIFYKVMKEGEEQPPTWRENRRLKRQQRLRALAAQTAAKPVVAKRYQK